MVRSRARRHALPDCATDALPYTTLFRSAEGRDAREHRLQGRVDGVAGEMFADRSRAAGEGAHVKVGAHPWAVVDRRSEEHTSELQSHVNLVCRLLLEKKRTVTPVAMPCN